MAKLTKTPASVLVSLMAEYNLNTFSLARALNLGYTTVRYIVYNHAGITVPMAYRLAKFFGNSPAFWLDLQRNVDFEEAGKNKKLQAELKKITKAVKPPKNSLKKSPAQSAKKPAAAGKKKK